MKIWKYKNIQILKYTNIAVENYRCDKCITVSKESMYRYIYTIYVYILYIYYIYYIYIIYTMYILYIYIFINIYIYVCMYVCMYVMYVYMKNYKVIYIKNTNKDKEMCIKIYKNIYIQTWKQTNILKCI